MPVIHAGQVYDWEGNLLGEQPEEHYVSALSGSGGSGTGEPPPTECVFYCDDSPCGCGDAPECDSDNVATREFVQYEITQNGDDGSYSALFFNQFNNEVAEFGHYQVSESGTIVDKGSWFTYRGLALNPTMRIRKAQLRFTAWNDGGTPDLYQEVDDTEVTISGHCSAGVARIPEFFDQPSTTIDQGGGLDTYWPRTATQIGWHRPAVTSEDEFTTPNIACILQELIHRADWESGDDITLFIDACTERPNGFETKELHQVYDYFSDPDKAAKLEIWYTFVFREEMSGGVVCGGSADVQLRMAPPVSGGVVVSGSGGTDYEEVMDGGVVVGGNANVSVTQTGNMSGGVVVGGDASVIQVTGPLLYRVKVTVPAGKVSTPLYHFHLGFHLELGEHMNVPHFRVTDMDDVEIFPEVRFFEAGDSVVLFFRGHVLPDQDNEWWVYYGREEV